MTEQDAIRSLLQHFMHRMNEFFNELPAEEIEEYELGTRFARWLHNRECHHAPFKTAQGVVAQHVDAEQVQDEEGITMARLMLFHKHGVGLMWMAELFVNPAVPLPDVVRSEIVKCLRMHADKLERREIDSRMKEIHQTGTGAA